MLRRLAFNASAIAYFSGYLGIRLFVPLLSLFLGSILFSVPQAADLFRDYDYDARILLVSSVQFILVATLVWALPVFVAARHFLQGAHPELLGEYPFRRRRYPI